MVTGLIRELIDAGQALRRVRGHRSDGDDRSSWRSPRAEYAENHRVAQRADGRRYGDVRRLPGDGGRQDLLHLRRRAGIRRSCRRFRRGDAPSGDVPHAGGARTGDRRRTRGGTPVPHGTRQINERSTKGDHGEQNITRAGARTGSGARATNFEEVCYGYNLEEARTEASRCLYCRNPRCVAACPVGVQIPDFISCLCEGDVAGAADVIARDSSLPSICARVCPQETQCEETCVLGIRGEPVAVGSSTVRGRLDANINVRRSAPAALPVARRPSGGCRGARACGSGLCERLRPRWVTRWKRFSRRCTKVGGVLVLRHSEFGLPKQKIVEREVEAVRRLGRRDRDRRDRRAHGDGRFAARRGWDSTPCSSVRVPVCRVSWGIGGGNLNGVVSANEFLTRANLMHAYDARYDTPIYVGQRVVVVGGGNAWPWTPCARQAARCGGDDRLPPFGGGASGACRGGAP